MAAPYFRIAVLSGKGGTGKTFVSVNLAATAQQAFMDILSEEGTVPEDGMVQREDVLHEAGIVLKDGTGRGIRALYADCDVEEPNGHLFLQPEDCCCGTVSVMVPEVDASKCNGCRTCVSFCKFHALAYLKGQVKVFRELCHGCNGCVLLCPTGAMSEGDRPIGMLESGVSGEVTVCTGTLNIGESTGVPVIHALLKSLGSSRAVAEPESLSVSGQEEAVRTESASAGDASSRSKLPYVAVLDCPPGSGCPVMESVRHADFCVLVAEPTAFGLHDLAMVADLVRVLGKPAGLLFNRCTDSSANLAEMASGLSLPLLGTIPFEPALARLLAEGSVAAREADAYRKRFAEVWEQIREVAGR